jgi:cation:H+ antiporter
MTISLFIAGGLLLLYLGAESLVRGGASLALKLGIAPLVVGLTVVAFGTSAPEMVVSVSAGVSGKSEIALGNVVGSNICNIGLILGLSAMLRPMKVQQQLVRFDVPIMIGTSLALIALLIDGHLSRIDGVLLAAALGVYLWVLIAGARREQDVVSEAITETIEISTLPLPRAILSVIGGLALLILGGKLFVDGAVALAETMGISERVIGLTVVAVGTSLPELATSMVAAWKKESDLSIGNVVGSNIFNVLAILGITAAVRPVSGAGFDQLDFGVMLAFAILLLPLARTGFSLTRLEGALMLAGYVGYTSYLVIR